MSKTENYSSEELESILKTLHFSQERLKDSYSRYVRPYTGNLLRVLSMDKNYIEGRGNLLQIQEEDGTIIDVIDACGGYGANIVGHKNPEVLSALIEGATLKSPMHVQGSLREGATLLAKKLSSILTHELSVVDSEFISIFSNSGTESVEVALKHSYLSYFQRVNDHKIKLTQIENSIKLDNDLKEKLNHQSIQLGFSSIEDLLKHNYQILSLRPISLALDKAFHGKTLGSLSLTYNKTQKEVFYVNSEQTDYVVPNDVNSLTNTFKRNTYILFVITIDESRRPIITQTQHNIVSGFFIEPIQGEGGIRVLEDNFLQSARTHCNDHQTLLVFDDVQSGMFRTGLLSAASHSKVIGDCYCFSKGLGGGYSKIAATMFNKSIFIDEFSYLHTSTFSEDEISSRVALKTLEILERPFNKKNAEKNSELLKEELNKIQKKFPHIIESVSGKGYLIGINLNQQIAELNMEFHTFNSAKLLGYFFCSSLLENEKIRIFPTLSAPMTLRIEPSIFLRPEEILWICKGIENLCLNIENQNSKYFLQHLYPGQAIDSFKILKVDHRRKIQKEKVTKVAFLAHLIDIKHLKKVFTSHSHIEEIVLRKKVSKISDILPFQTFYKGNIFASNGNICELHLVGLPMMTEDILKNIKAGNSHFIVNKINESIAACKEQGIFNIGLGQFTSIVTNNGLLIPQNDINITTGNSYTTMLSVDAVLESVRVSGQDITTKEAVFVGAAGNIVSTTAALLADHVKKITLIYHTPLIKSQKYQQTIIQLLNEIQMSTADSPVIVGIRHILNQLNIKNVNFSNLSSILEHPLTKTYLSLSSNLDDVYTGDIVVTGTNSDRPILFASHFKKEAIIVDIGVPSNVDPKIRIERPDLQVFMGGLANLPSINNEIQSIQTSMFPLGAGQSFACLAETLMMSLVDHSSPINHVGPLNKQMALRTKNWANETGFSLGNLKVFKSF